MALYDGLKVYILKFIIVGGAEGPFLGQFSAPDFPRLLGWNQ